MLKILLQVLGRLLALTPEPLLRGLGVAVGDAVFWTVPRRRRLVLSNLAHAFPERDANWRRRIGRESCRRLVETVLLSLASPFFSDARIRKMARLTPRFEAWLRDYAARPRPTVCGTVHCALWEGQTWLSLLCAPVPQPEFGIIFRPLDHAAADSFVKTTRERHGMKLLSRKEGFSSALKILRRNGCVGLLFDQNAGHQGALTTFFGRVCSTTELPGVLAEKFTADVRTFYPRRTGFWRLELDSDAVAHDDTAAGVTFALNRWLESALSSDDELCASWLWAHDRWRHQDEPGKRFRLESKRDLLAADLQARGLAAPPRRTRVFVRLPNWLGDVVMALPLLRALRADRPDAELTLFARPQFLPLLASWNVADRLEPLPPRGPGYFAHFWRLRRRYPDVFLIFTNSFRGDLEAWLTRCPQRFGLVRPGKWRPLLTRRWHVPAEFAETEKHQLALWENFLRAFGLQTPPDRTPFPAPATRPAPPQNAVGLIVGSENTPGKRWPVAHWRSLIAALPEIEFTIFGTAGDAALAQAVAEGFGPRVHNLAGRTDLPGFAEKLTGCALLMTNDTGGMHLANALGVPLIALFGPTNPLRTGPVFAAPFEILQPPGCPPAGGGALAGLTPETVTAAVRKQLNCE